MRCEINQNWLHRRVRLGLFAFAVSFVCIERGLQAQSAGIENEGANSFIRETITKHCVDCHQNEKNPANFDVAKLDPKELGREGAAWEKIVRRVATGQMPPPDSSELSSEDRERFLVQLMDRLDEVAREQPHPGSTETFRRLTRLEYQNAIRDLLDLEISATNLLPQDESSHGFDNITVSDLSSTRMNRYVVAAEKIARQAIASPTQPAVSETFRIRGDQTQEEHVEGLPLGTRGGMVIPFNFPRDGVYEVQIRLMRDRNEEVEGLNEPHQLDVLVDRKRVERFTVAPPPGRKDFSLVDKQLIAKFEVTAGPHNVGVTFVKNPSSILETRRQPLQAHFNMHRHPRIGPAVYQATISGPLESAATQSGHRTPSQSRIFVVYPSKEEEEEDCAKEILSRLMRRAYRRAVTNEDIAQPMALFRATRKTGGFEEAIESGLSGILVNPNFLFRIERSPVGFPSGSAYSLSSFELASRLSFFLWSSIPDDRLLDLAEREELQKPDVLAAEVKRMLADERTTSLATNFAGQWLHLRNLESITPDLRLFPDFDDNLRQAFRKETELLFDDVLRADRSVLELLRSKSTYLNERLAKHYGIDSVYGTRWRKVELDESSHRGGILRHGSVLTVTSYATRTSPVIRGHWILKNVLGTPPPPPPPNVPALDDNVIAASLPIRERLEQHRRDSACAVCHNLMDPVGFALENFDAVGRWRELENGKPIDSSGALPNGRQLDGLEGLEAALLEQPESFVATVAEKLLTYAVGRGLDHHDAPAIRQIVRSTKESDYKMSSIVLGVVQSVPFRMRSAQ